MKKSRLRSEMSNKISPFLRGFGQRPQSRNPSPKGKKISISTALDPKSTSNLVLAAVEVDERRIGRPKGRRFLYAFLQSPSEGGDGSPVTNSSPGGTVQGTVGGSSSSSALLNTDSPMNSTVRMCTLRSYKEWTAEMPKFDQIEKPCNYK
jgi:hypothetical protein